jgi:hypothetical protein
VSLTHLKVGYLCSTPRKGKITSKIPYLGFSIDLGTFKQAQKVGSQAEAEQPELGFG